MASRAEPSPPRGGDDPAAAVLTAAEATPPQAGASPASIEVTVRGDRVRKHYRRDALPAREAEARFARECAAYGRLAELGADFAPRLLERDADALWLEIEHVAGGRSIVDWLDEAATNSFEPVIAQLVRIDRFLYRNRINYLGGSPRDVLVGEDYRLFLIDFEYTWLDERWEDCLCDRMFHPRLARVANLRNRDLFLAMLAARRKEFHRYARRRLAGAAARRLGLGRGRHLVRR